MIPEKISEFLGALAAKKFLLIAIVIALIAIGGGVYYFYTRTVDETPPSIHLTSPTADDWYATSENSITVEGLAVDDESGVKNITWGTDKGESGSVTISNNSWSIAEVSLSQGDNKITITAVDNKDNSSSVVLNVVYNPSVLFYDLTLSQDSIYKSATAEKITVRAGVEAEEGKTISAVRLYQVTNGGREELTPMLDNGSIVNGDDIPSDNIYSAIYSFSSETTDPVILRVGAAINNTVSSYSGVMTINVLVQLSEAQFSEILSTNTEINNKFEELLAESKKPKTAAKEMAEWLTEREDVEVAGVSENGFGVWWQDKETGILSGIQNTPAGKKGREQINTEAVERSNQGAVKGLTHQRSTPISFGAARPAHAAEDDLEVKSTKAIYLGPYFSDFGADDDYNHNWQTILKLKCPECQTVEKKNTDVTVEDFKTLSNYGLIVISSHGDTWFGGTFGTAAGQVVTHTSQTVTTASRLYYLPDLLLNRLAIDARDNTLVVLPSFIKKYNGSFPNSVVFLSTCRSSYNFTMASAYLSKGAKAFLGFNEYVWADYAGKIGDELIKSFLEKGKTIGEAWAEATNIHGANDGDGGGYVPAWYDIWGWTNLKMGGIELQNEGFEERLVGWNTEGDARVITSLGALKPQEGKRMGIISTGLGSVSDSNSAVTQTLCVTEGKLSISFKYNFVSEEPMEYYGSAYDDSFVATVYINGTATTLVRRSINNSSWHPIGGINFAGGDITTYYTGWATISKDLGNVKQGDIVKIDFRVGDRGDSAYDSAALVDAVKLEVK